MTPWYFPLISEFGRLVLNGDEKQRVREFPVLNKFNCVKSSVMQLIGALSRQGLNPIKQTTYPSHLQLDLPARSRDKLLLCSDDGVVSLQHLRLFNLKLTVVYVCRFDGLHKALKAV